jgi:hypothetical protein
MNKDSHPPSNFKTAEELRREAEAFGLRRDETRLTRNRRNVKLTWLSSSIYSLVGFLEAVLVLRLLVQISPISFPNHFTQQIYTISDRLIMPFSSLFTDAVTNVQINSVTVSILVAMIGYALLGWLCIRITKSIST